MFSKKKFSALLCCWFLGASSLFAQQANEQKVAADTAVKLQVLENISSMPISFRKNEGQWDEAVLYRGFSPGWNANINFLKNGLSFGVSRRVQEEKKEPAENRIGHYNNKNIPKERLVWNLYFKGIHPGVSFIADGREDSHANYLKGNDPAKHCINVGDYRMFTYKNVYDNIDARYYSTGQSIKYDIILKPGADVNKVQMQFEGIKKVAVNAKKQLEITNNWGTLIEEMPESYQFINGKKVLVDVEYSILDETTFGFKIKGAYNKAYELIIDPVIMAWGTWVGATTQTDEGYCHNVAVDAAGNVYSTGFYEDNFPITPGAYGSTYQFMQDVFVLKLSPNASSLIYATYLGGNGSDWGYAVKANAAGECYVTGRTSSSNFPVTAGAYQTTFMAGGFDAFVTKLNPTGTAAVYSTFVGGTSDDEAYDLALNAAGEVYICGVGSAGFPVTPGVVQPAIPAGYGGFVSKLNAAGSSLIYSTLIGGSSGNYAYGLDVSAAGEAFVVGETGSWVNVPPNYTDFPVTSGAYKTYYGNCGWKGWIAKLNPTATAYVYCSLIGGGGSCPLTGPDVAIDVVVNSAGEAYVIGNTGSANFPTTPNAYDKIYGNGDAFLLKLNAAGSQAIYATFYGGNMGETVCGLAVNSAGEAFISGFTETDDGTFPVTSCAFQSTFGGQSTSSTGRGDMFLAKFDATASNLLYSTFIGGNSDDYKYPHVALFGPCEEEAIMNGTSHSPNFPTTPGVFMQNKGNGYEDQPVLFKLKPKINPFFKWNTPQCNLTVNFTDSTTGNCVWQAGPWTPSTWHWDFGDGTTSAQQNPTHTYAASGTYSVKLVVTCPKDSIIIPVTVSTTGGSASIAPVQPICIGSSVVLTASGGSSYQWSTGATTATITVSPTVTTTYSVVTTGNCPGSATVSVVVNPLPTVNVGSNSPLCVNQNLNLTSGGGVTYAWTGPNSFTSTTQNPSITGATTSANGTYTVVVTDANGCVNSGTTNVTVNPALNIVFSADTVCMGSNTTFTDQTPGVPPGLPYNWAFGDGTTSAQSSPVTHQYPNSGVYTCTLSIGNSTSCINSGTLQVVVKALPLVNPQGPFVYCPLQVTQPINFTSTPGGASSTFFWANTNTAIGLAAGGTGNLPSFTTANPGSGSITAIVMVHAAYNGCTGPDSAIMITVNPNPVADFFGQSKICQGTSMQLTDNSSGAIVSWNWDLNGDGVFADATSQDPSYTFSTPGTHTVSLVASVNAFCKDTVTKTVYVNPIPQPAFVGDHLSGCPVLNVKFSDQSTIAAPAVINSWSWNFGNGSTYSGQFPPATSYNNLSHTQTATYTVSLTLVSDSGCTAILTKSNYISVYPRPTADFNYAIDNNSGDGIDPTVHFYDASTGANQVHWYLGDVFANPASANYTSANNPVHTYIHEEGYTYYVTQWAVNSFGCADSITKPIEVQPGFTFYIPNAFSPDGDNINDGFKGTGIGIDNSTYHLYIFDRWGNMVFKANDLERSWDGRKQGHDEVVQEDVYVWKVDFNDFSGKKHEYKGTVSLIK